MKYLKKFNTETEYNTAVANGKIENPCISYFETKVKYGTANSPLWILALNDLTVSFTKDIEYKLQGSEWTALPANTESPIVKIGTKIFFRSPVVQTEKGTTGVGTFSISDTCYVGGNIMSMGDPNYKNRTTMNCTFAYMFKNCDKLVNASFLLLPAKTVIVDAYCGMFYGCTSLEIPPRLPATTVGQASYSYMFYNCIALSQIADMSEPNVTGNFTDYSNFRSMYEGCKSLTTANPKWTSGGYYTAQYMFRNCTSLTKYSGSICNARNGSIGMFYGCTALTTVPTPFPSSVSHNTFQDMFYGCTSLVTAPKLPAESVGDWCYQRMFYGCTSLVTAPELPATSGGDQRGYEEMFYGCTSLVSAPLIMSDATEVDSMFNGCSKLSYIKYLGITAPYRRYAGDSYWVKNVSSEGTFVMNSDATWMTVGVSGIPLGWEIQRYDTAVDRTFVRITIGDATYESDLNMTWSDWITSEYNIDNYVLDENNNIITDTGKLLLGTTAVLGTDIVKHIAGTNYIIETND